jgi:hypothetical protein
MSISSIKTDERNTKLFKVTHPIHPLDSWEAG